MTEPSSTGIGGDMFMLFYDAATKKVSALNGSGREGSRCTLPQIRSDLGLQDGQSGKKIPKTSVHAVTVPGAAAGWWDAVERFGSGKVSMTDVLEGAIELGEHGFVVSELTSVFVSIRASGEVGSRCELGGKRSPTRLTTTVVNCRAHPPSSISKLL